MHRTQQRRMSDNLLFDQIEEEKLRSEADHVSRTHESRSSNLYSITNVKKCNFERKLHLPITCQPFRFTLHAWKGRLLTRRSRHTTPRLFINSRWPALVPWAPKSTQAISFLRKFLLLVQFCPVSCPKLWSFSTWLLQLDQFLSDIRERLRDRMDIAIYLGSSGIGIGNFVVFLLLSGDWTTWKWLAYVRQWTSFDPEELVAFRAHDNTRMCGEIPSNEFPMRIYGIYIEL